MLGYRRNRWFRFSSREMLLIIALAAIGLAWYADHQRLLNAWERDHVRQLTRIQRLKDTLPGWFDANVREEPYEKAEDSAVREMFFK